MMEVFANAFAGTFQAVLQILIIVVAASLLVRKKLVSEEQVKAICAITVRILLPCLIFSNVVKYFYPGKLHIWPIIPLAAVAMIAVGLLAGIAVFARELPQKKDMLSLASLQNAGYLVLPIGSVLFPDQFEQFKLYCFLYFLGISPILWSLGKYLISSGADAKMSIRELITPPFAANLLAITLVFTHLRLLVPSVLLDSIEFVGTATVPVATFILGAVLGGSPFNLRPYIADATRVALVKMLFVPLCTVAALYFAGLGASHPLLASFFVIQASAAPATAAVIQVKHYGGDQGRVSSVVLLNYLLGIIAMPFWVALWKAVSA